MPELNFRDFAGAVMSGRSEDAARVLAELLALTPDGAARATGHFEGRMRDEGQAFMMKAMGLRTAVTSGDQAQIRALLGECFGLEGDALDLAVAAVQRRYGRQRSGRRSLLAFSCSCARLEWNALAALERTDDQLRGPGP